MRVILEKERAASALKKSKEEIETVRDTKALDSGQLEFMWNFLKFGTGKANIPALRENLDNLRQMMIQKTGGQEQYKHREDVDMDDIRTICKMFVCHCRARADTADDRGHIAPAAAPPHTADHSVR